MGRGATVQRARHYLRVVDSISILTDLQCLSTLSPRREDSAGPALNPMIKVINMVSAIIAPLIVTTSKNAAIKPYIYGGVVVLLAIVAVAIQYSKKEAQPLIVEEPAAVPTSGNSSSSK